MNATTNLVIVINNIEDAREGYTRAFVVPDGTSPADLDIDAVDHIDIPADEDEHAWEAGFRAEVARAGWVVDGPIANNLGTITVATRRAA